MHRKARVWVGIGALGIVVATGGTALAEEITLSVAPPSRAFIGTCERMTTPAAPAPSTVALTIGLRGAQTAPRQPGPGLPAARAPLLSIDVSIFRSGNLVFTRNGVTTPHFSWSPPSAGHYRLHAAIVLDKTPKSVKSIDDYRVPLTVGLMVTPGGGPRRVTLRAEVGGTPAGAASRYAFCVKPLEPAGPSQWRPMGDANESSATWTVTVPALGVYRLYVGVLSGGSGPLVAEAEGEQIVPSYSVTQ